MRSLAEDMGRMLGCGAFVSALRRTRAGPFSIEDSVTLATLEALQARRVPERLKGCYCLPMQRWAPYRWSALSESGGFYMRQGQPVMVPNAPRGGIVRVALETGEFLGIGEILDDGRVAPRRLIVTGR